MAALNAAFAAGVLAYMITTLNVSYVWHVVWLKVPYLSLKAWSRLEDPVVSLEVAAVVLQVRDKRSIMLIIIPILKNEACFYVLVSIQKLKPSSVRIKRDFMSTEIIVQLVQRMFFASSSARGRGSILDLSG